MKKFILLMAGVASFAAANAQRITIGPEVGFNMSNVWLHDTRGNVDDRSSGDAKPGLKIGGVLDIGASPFFSIQPGLFYSMKGYKLDEIRNGAGGVPLTRADASRRVNLNYVELPLNLVFKAGHPGGPKFMIGAGIYAAYAVGGKVKYGDYLGSSRNTSEDLHFGDNERTDDFRQGDFGGQVFIGFITRHGAFMRAQYQGGIANIDVYGDDDYTVRNATGSLTFGFLLGDHGRGANHHRGHGHHRVHDRYAD